MAKDVATPLPAVDLNPQSVLTVTLDQAGAKITGLWVHGWQDDNVDTTSTIPADLNAGLLPG